MRLVNASEYFYCVLNEKYRNRVLGLGGGGGVWWLFFWVLLFFLGGKSELKCRTSNLRFCGWLKTWNSSILQSQNITRLDLFSSDLLSQFLWNKISLYRVAWGWSKTIHTLSLIAYFIWRCSFRTRKAFISMKDRTKSLVHIKVWLF